MRYLSALLLSGFFTVAHANPCAAAVSPELRVPSLLKFTDDASQALGIGVLRNTQVPQGNREIRLWTGFGVAIPHQVTVFKVTPSGKVSGAVHLWYEKPDYLSARERRAFRDVLKTDWGCTQFPQHGKYEVCRSGIRPDGSWNDLLLALESSELLCLPDESTLPEPEIIVTDGFSLVVEIRDGSEYRAYGYSNPWARSERESQAAAKLMRLLNEALSPST